MYYTPLRQTITAPHRPLQRLQACWRGWHASGQLRAAAAAWRRVLALGMLWLVALAAGSAHALPTGPWERVGPLPTISTTGAAYTSAATGPDGRLYVAYRDRANGDKATVMRINSTGTGWEAVGAVDFSAGQAFYTSLAFGSDGKPYVAYQDAANGRKVTVMRLISDSAGWEAVGGAGLSAGEAYYTSLAFGSDGKPYVAYRDNANGDKATVMRLKSDNTGWEAVGGAGFSAGRADYTSLAFDSDGKPYVAYRDNANGDKAMVMRLKSDSAGWEAVGGAGFSTGGAEYISLAFASDGKPYVAYSDSANGYKATVMRLNSDSAGWEAVGGAGLSAGVALYTSLAFGSDGKPYVAYQDVANVSKATVMRLNSAGTGWETVGTAGFSAGRAPYISLAFGSDGKPYVAYQDVANFGKAAVMRINSAGTGWEAVGGAGFSAGVTLYTSLAFGSDGKPYVAYSDSANGDKATVMRLKSDSAGWEAVGDAGFSAGGPDFISLAFGSDGKPYVAYSDAPQGSIATVMRWTQSTATAPQPPAVAALVPGDGQLVVSWAAPANTGGMPTTGYTATAYAASAPTTPAGQCSTAVVAPATSPATTCTITGLSNGTAYTVQVTATNGVGTSAAGSSPGAVAPTASLTVPVTTLPGAVVGRVYSAQVQPTGGMAPYRFALVAGSLPAGLGLNTDTGAITGTPTTASALPVVFSLQISDSTVPKAGLQAKAMAKDGPTVNQVTLSFSMAVTNAPVVPGDPTATATPVPTVHHLALLLLSLMAAAMGGIALRRKQAR